MAVPHVQSVWGKQDVDVAFGERKVIVDGKVDTSSQAFGGAPENTFLGLTLPDPLSMETGATVDSRAYHSRARIRY